MRYKIVVLQSVPGTNTRWKYLLKDEFESDEEPATVVLMAQRIKAVLTDSGDSATLEP